MYLGTLMALDLDLISSPLTGLSQPKFMGAEQETSKIMSISVERTDSIA